MQQFKPTSASLGYYSINHQHTECLFRPTFFHQTTSALFDYKRAHSYNACASPMLHYIFNILRFHVVVDDANRPQNVSILLDNKCISVSVYYAEQTENRIKQPKQNKNNQIWISTAIDIDRCVHSQFCSHVTCCRITRKQEITASCCLVTPWFPMHTNNMPLLR